MGLSKLLTGTRNKSGGPRSNPANFWTKNREKRKGPWTGFKGVPRSRGN